jgi:hypothetical protein
VFRCWSGPTYIYVATLGPVHTSTQQSYNAMVQVLHERLPCGPKPGAMLVSDDRRFSGTQQELPFLVIDMSTLGLAAGEADAVASVVSVGETARLGGATALEADGAGVGVDPQPATITATRGPARGA